MSDYKNINNVIDINNLNLSDLTRFDIELVRLKNNKLYVHYYYDDKNNERGITLICSSLKYKENMIFYSIVSLSQIIHQFDEIDIEII
jgi:hypothetical protein